MSGKEPSLSSEKSANDILHDAAIAAAMGKGQPSSTTTNGLRSVSSVASRTSGGLSQPHSITELDEDNYTVNAHESYNIALNKSLEERRPSYERAVTEPVKLHQLMPGTFTASGTEIRRDMSATIQPVTPSTSTASGGANTSVAVEMSVPVAITFSEVTYGVDRPVKKLSFAEKMQKLSLTGFPKTEMARKVLLNDISGTILPNTMTALMGPSGAGKSTLLDVLAGRKNTGFIDGEILFNGNPMSPDIKRTLGYVEQTDTLIETLTVRQLLTYTARLKLPSSWSREKIDKRVVEVIDELGLQRCCDTRIGGATVRGISGGQAKRVNIGIELITNPRVLFLDEPTTGLDSATSFEVMSVMRHVADNGRSIIATIHQPSSDVFRLFNRLLLLVDGEVTYLGPIPQAVPYFESMGYVYNPKTNPAEFIVAVMNSSGAHKEVEGPTVPRTFFAEQYRKSDMFESRLQSLKATRETAARGTSAVLAPPVHFANSRLHNFLILSERMLNEKFHNASYWLSRMVKICFLVFILATLFANQGDDHDSAGVLSVVSILQFSMMTFSFGALQAIGEEINAKPFFNRERNSATYQVSAWYFANIITELPGILLQIAVWSVVVYWSVALRSSASAFFLFCLLLFLTTLVGQCMGQFFAFMMPRFDAAQSFGFPIVLVTFLFAGFYVRKPLIPDYFVWLYYISYMQYCGNALNINQFDSNIAYTQQSVCYNCNPSATCSTSGFSVIFNNITNCCIPTQISSPWSNQDLLIYWGYGEVGAIDSIWGNALTLIGFIIVWGSVAYAALRFRKYGQR